MYVMVLAVVFTGRMFLRVERSIFGQMGSLLKQMGSFLITGMLLTLISCDQTRADRVFGGYMGSYSII